MRANITMIAFFAVSACSETPLPTKVADIEGTVKNSAFYMYRPGGTLDDYMSLEINRGSVKQTVLSISRCSFAAAKISSDVINTVLFESDFSGKSHAVSGATSPGRPLTTIIRSVDAAPSEGELAKLKRTGFTVIACKFAG